MGLSLAVATAMVPDRADVDTYFGRAIGGAAVGILPAGAAGVLGAFAGSVGGDAGGIVGFAVAYELMQGFFTTLAAPARR